MSLERGLVVFALVALSGCAEDNLGYGVPDDDGGGADQSVAAGELGIQGGDLAVSPGGDMALADDAAPPDFAVGVGDIAMPDDIAGASPDIAGAPPDMALPLVDLAGADLSNACPVASRGCYGGQM